MRRFKLLCFKIDAYSSGRKEVAGIRRMQTSDGLVYGDFPSMEPVVNGYLAKGWTISQISVHDSHIYVLLT